MYKYFSLLYICSYECNGQVVHKEIPTERKEVIRDNFTLDIAVELMSNLNVNHLKHLYIKHYSNLESMIEGNSKHVLLIRELLYLQYIPLAMNSVNAVKEEIIKQTINKLNNQINQCIEVWCKDEIRLLEEINKLIRSIRSSKEIQSLVSGANKGT